MSLLSTIAHEGAPSARRPSVTAILVTTMLALAVAAAGIRIFDGMTHRGSEALPASSAGLTGEEFVRLNTTALPELGVAGSAVSALGELPGTMFLRLNTTDLPKVVGSAVSASDTEFLRLNTTDLPKVVGSAVSASDTELVRLNTTGFPPAIAPQNEGPASGPR